ncbi:acyl carrier protein [Hydrogenophaga sp. PAMC20947]|nr:acyl carrier protein [Hydrogenophaga sp. PAMC20947]
MELNAPADLDELIPEVAALIVEALNLDVASDEIEPDGALYGDTLGLDSIDMLEMSLTVSRRYGFQLRSDGEQNQLVFASLRSLCTHIAQHRTK